MLHLYTLWLYNGLAGNPLSTILYFQNRKKIKKKKEKRNRKNSFVLLNKVLRHDFFAFTWLNYCCNCNCEWQNNSCAESVPPDCLFVSLFVCFRKLLMQFHVSFYCANNFKVIFASFAKLKSKSYKHIRNFLNLGKRVYNIIVL